MNEAADDLARWEQLLEDCRYSDGAHLIEAVAFDVALDAVTEAYAAGVAAGRLEGVSASELYELEARIDFVRRSFRAALPNGWTSFLATAEEFRAARAIGEATRTVYAEGYDAGRREGAAEERERLERFIIREPFLWDDDYGVGECRFCGGTYTRADFPLDPDDWHGPECIWLATFRDVPQPETEESPDV